MDCDLSFCFDIDMVLVESQHCYLTSSIMSPGGPVPKTALRHNNNSFDSDLPTPAFKRRTVGKNWTSLEQELLLSLTT